MTRQTKLTLIAARLLAIGLIGAATFAGPAPAAEADKAALPDPPQQTPNTNKPAKVFILMGQSNMLGFGRIGPENQQGTLEHLVKKQHKYPHLIDDAGQWTQRQDVWYKHANLAKQGSRWLKPAGQHIGPELQFGHVMGHVHDELVIILEASIGNRGLGWDIRPPSSRTIPPEDHPNKWHQGWQYDIFVKKLHGTLDNLPKHVPAYDKDQGYEIAGFVWWQGHKDQGTPERIREGQGHLKKDIWAESYEAYLVQLIKDLRDEFDADKAPFVVATIAFGGWDLSGSGLTIAKAQLAVDGDAGNYPQFKGNVKTVEARDYWQDKSVSPSAAGYHYNHNAETYMNVGNDMGWAMAELLGKDR
jgi:alpha-galactosidase